MYLIKKVIVLFFIMVSVAVAASSPALADDGTPLIVIRFNHDAVEYERSLERVVSSALEIKPTTFFDLVTVIPGEENSRTYRSHKKFADAQVQQIATDLQRSGVSPERIRVTYQNNQLVNNNEVHVFVR